MIGCQPAQVMVYPTIGGRLFRYFPNRDICTFHDVQVIDASCNLYHSIRNARVSAYRHSQHIIGPHYQDKMDSQRLKYHGFAPQKTVSLTSIF